MSQTNSYLSNRNDDRRVKPPAPPCSSWLVAAVLMLLTIAGGATGVAQSSNQTITAFENATKDYALMHRRLERQIGSIEFGTPVAEINRIIHELAAAVRAERTSARQGDIFTPALAQVLRARINEALLEHQSTAEAVRGASRVDGVDYEQVRLKVNDTFPWILSTAMFPCVIEALPPLPPELQYRIVGGDLVLIDVHASLVVDILPQALADLTASYPQSGGGLR
jgi:hypothetical protein